MGTTMSFASQAWTRIASRRSASPAAGSFSLKPSPYPAASQGRAGGGVSFNPDEPMSPATTPRPRGARSILVRTVPRAAIEALVARLVSEGVGHGG